MQCTNVILRTSGTSGVKVHIYDNILYKYRGEEEGFRDDAKLFAHIVCTFIQCIIIGGKGVEVER